eukprot:UN28613
MEEEFDVKYKTQLERVKATGWYKPRKNLTTLNKDERKKLHWCLRQKATGWTPDKIDMELEHNYFKRGAYVETNDEFVSHTK